MLAITKVLTGQSYCPGFIDLASKSDRSILALSRSWVGGLKIELCVVYFAFVGYAVGASDRSKDFVKIKLRVFSSFDSCG